MRWSFGCCIFVGQPSQGCRTKQHPLVYAAEVEPQPNQHYGVRRRKTRGEMSRRERECRAGGIRGVVCVPISSLSSQSLPSWGAPVGVSKEAQKHTFTSDLSSSSRLPRPVPLSSRQHITFSPVSLWTFTSDSLLHQKDWAIGQCAKGAAHKLLSAMQAERQVRSFDTRPLQEINTTVTLQ